MRWSIPIWAGRRGRSIPCRCSPATIPNLTTQYANNVGPLVRNNRMENNGTNGMEVRGGTLTTESVWDDVDIVHVLRRKSSFPICTPSAVCGWKATPQASLVVKLSGANAGFTAGGLNGDPGAPQSTTNDPLGDIDDRVGGTVQIIGTPGRPVSSPRSPTIPSGPASNRTARRCCSPKGQQRRHAGRLARDCARINTATTATSPSITKWKLPPAAAPTRMSAPDTAEFLGSLAPSDRLRRRQPPRGV